MPSTQLYNRGADNSVFSHPVYTNVKRSRFNLSKKKFFNADVGMIMPVDLIPTLPGDDFEISCSYILETLPLVAPSMTNYKIRTHWYYIDNSSLWSGWSTFITKGRSGSIDLSVPSFNDEFHNNWFYPVGDYAGYVDLLSFLTRNNGPMSLMSFLGLNPKYMTGDPSSIDSSALISTTYYSQATYLPYSGFGAYSYVNNVSIDDEGNYLDENGDSFTFPVSANSSTSVGAFFYSIPSSYNPYLINILPFLFYQKIYRQNYINENLMQDNKIWFPDDVTDGWRINYSASNLCNVVGGTDSSNYNRVLFTPADSFEPYSCSALSIWSPFTPASYTDMVMCANIVPKVTDNAVNLTQMRYAMFENDYFTTALPWQQRGTAPTLDVDFDYSNDVSVTDFSGVSISSPTSSTFDSDAGLFVGSSGTEQVDSTNSSTYLNVSSNGQVYLSSQADNTSTSSSSVYLRGHASASAYQTFLNSLTLDGSVTGSVSGNFSQALFTLSDLRSLIALSVWQERNARTNGSYNSTIYAHFETNPKHNEYEPVYIGGTSDDVQFTRVIQTSESSSDSPLGSEAGLGSSQANGFVGRFRCNDYGFIMGVMIISPEVSYAQTIQHFWTELSQSDYYMPEFSSLSLQPILNYEIYPQESSLTDTSDDGDNGLFGYQERYTYLKQRSNTVSGLFALPSDVDSLFSAYAQERWFDSLPQLSQQFVTMSPDNLRRDWLAYPSQPAFKVQFASNIFATRPLPYQNVPVTFGF